MVLIIVSVVIFIICCIVVVGVRIFIGLVVLSMMGLMVRLLLVVIFSRLNEMFVVFSVGMMSMLVCFLRCELGNVVCWICLLSVVLLCILFFILSFGVCFCKCVRILCIFSEVGVFFVLNVECDNNVIFGWMLKLWICLVVSSVMLVSCLVVGL